MEMPHYHFHDADFYDDRRVHDLTPNGINYDRPCHDDNCPAAHYHVLTDDQYRALRGDPLAGSGYGDT